MFNKFFVLLTLFFVIGGIAVASGTAEPNLVAWYRFDDGSGTVANDLSGNNYDGTVSSSSNWASDSYGYHLSNATTWGNLYVDVPSDVFSTVDSQITVSMWICNPNADYNMGALIKASAPTQGKDNILKMSIYDNDGSTPTSYYFASTAGEDSSGNSDIQWWWGYNDVYSNDLEEWHHVVMVKNCDEEIEKLYYDGVEVANYTCDGDKTMAGIENCRIFTRVSSGTNNWYDSYHGKMADIKIFDRALSAQEISEQAGTNLVGWWKFEETSGTVAHDSGACRYDGTLGNNNSFNGGVVFTGDNYGASKVAFTSSDISDIFGNIDNEITISFWAKNDLANSSGHSQLFTGKNSSDNVILQVELPASNGAMVFKAGSSDRATVEGVNDSSHKNYQLMEEWNHYTLVKNAAKSEMIIYINGLNYVTATGKSQSIAGVTSFEFCGSSVNWNQFAGIVRDFRIYSTALTPLDVVDVYRQYQNEFNNTYYVDAVNGSDSNSGTSPSSAWQSLSKLNSTTFQPLDRILLKAGCVWNGQLKPKGSGKSGEPIVIDAYGDISNETNKPRINGQGNYGGALYVLNVNHWEINNLQVTNLGATRGAWRRGVYVRSSDFGTMRHIHLKNLYVHSVNGVLAKEDGGGSGINWFCSGDTTPTRFDDLLIEGCHIKTTDRDGITGGNSKIGMVTNAWPRSSTDWYPSLRVVIRGNYLEDIGGDGIIAAGCDGALIEYNVINGGACRTYNYSNPSQAACGIWPWSSDNTTIQYNEVTGMKGTYDGQGYDCDYNCAYTLFQYNYSHGNEGGFMLTCDNDDGIGNISPVVRYNISENDEDVIFSIGAAAAIYNNVIYNGSGTDVFLIKDFDSTTGRGNFKNNIFMSEGTYRFGYKVVSEHDFSYNCWRADKFRKEILWNMSGIFVSGRPGSSTEITSNPLFVNAGSGGSGIDSVDGYKLQSTSPCICVGTSISNNGGQDYWGNPLYNGNPDIGANERQ